MRVLALDAALGSCSVALLDEGICVDVRHGADSRAATGSLPTLVQDLLSQHGGRLDAVAVTIGPGSFTGLRGALALAHGLALGAGVPVVPVTVAEALRNAAPALPDRASWVAIDSRRAGRIFLGIGDDMAALSLAALPTPAGPVAVFGDAALLVVGALQRAGGDAVSVGDGRIDAAAVGRVGLRRLCGELPSRDVQPFYVEPPEARVASSLRPAPG